MNPDALHLTITLSTEDLEDLLTGKRDEFNWSLVSREGTSVETRIYKSEFDAEVSEGQ